MGRALSEAPSPTLPRKRETERGARVRVGPVTVLGQARSYSSVNGPITSSSSFIQLASC
ncbi:MAG: hypothetical protein K0R27_1925 [Xanthobacteraceae bacterium]|jgi:hypothetical protein|nr:hypothetical protein [Xanthobacteraceae bacterium]